MENKEKDLSLNPEDITENIEETVNDKENISDEIEKTVKDTADETVEKAEKAAEKTEDKTVNSAVSPKNDTKKKKNIKGGIINFFKSRKAKRGGLAVLLSVVFIAIIVGLNFVSALLVDRFPALSLDLTSSSVYELQSDTIDYIKEIKDPITIYVLASESDFESQGDYYVQVNKLLNKFPHYNSNITVKYVDLTAQPTFTTKYSNYDWGESSYVLLVECGDQYRALSATDIFDYNQETYSYYGQYVAEGQHVEQAVVTAILNVTSTDKIKVSLLGGQDESDPSGIKTLLENNAFEIEEISLLNTDISEDSQFLIIYAPTVDLDDDALEKITTWLENGGQYGHNLVYFPNDQIKDDLPNIDKLLADWGIKTGDGLIFETDTTHMTNTNNPYLITIMDYADETYTEGLKTTEIPVVMPYTVPIEITDSNKAKALLTSSDKAVIMPFDADENWDPAGAETGTRNGAVLSTALSGDTSSNLIVFGSYEAASQSALTSNSFNNAAYIVNLFNKLADREDVGITIEGKSLDNTALGMTDTATVTLISILVRFVLPLAILIAGLIVWLRRRNK